MHMYMYVQYTEYIAFRSFEEAHVLMLLKPWATCTGTCTPNIPEGESIFCDMHAHIQTVFPISIYMYKYMYMHLYSTVPVVCPLECIQVHVHVHVVQVQCTCTLYV